MNTTIVKQVTFCEDIWGEIKSHLVRPKPTCCECQYCDDRTKIQPLYSIPSFDYTTKIVDANGDELLDTHDRPLHKIEDFPLYYEETRKQNEEKLMTIEIVDKQEKKILYYCAECFANKLEYSGYGGYRGQDIHTKIKNYLKTENPTWDEKKLTKKTEEEKEWVCGKKEEKGVAVPTPLFATHRLKKTQDKIKKYEEFAFNLIKKDHHQRIKEHNNFIANQRKELDKRKRDILIKRQRLLVMPLFEEIILRKSARLFNDKKIDVATFKWINNNIPRGAYDLTISWNDMINQFNKQQEGRTHLGRVTQKNIVLPPLVEALETPQSN
jgi:hypothetical protein